MFYSEEVGSKACAGLFRVTFKIAEKSGSQTYLDLIYQSLESYATYNLS